MGHDYRIISARDAEARYAIADRIWYPYQEFGDEQEIRLYEGGVVVDGDFCTESGVDWNPFNVIVDGNLTVKGNIEWHDFSGGNFLFVTGDVRTTNLVAQGCPAIVIGGDLLVDHGVMGFYGDDGGQLIVDGGVEARVLINVYYFNMEIRGEVRATVVGDPYRMNIPVDFDDEDVEGVLVAPAVDADGCVEAHALAGLLREGEEVLRPGIKPAHVEALELLERLRENPDEVTELDLAARKLRGFPNIATEFPNLEKLVLSENTIASLPPEIARLQSLQELYLTRTGLEKLPPELGELTNLRVLDLSGNALDALPPELGRLSQLHTLRLSNTECDLPETLEQLEHLEELDLSFRGREEPVAIPAVVTRCRSLKRLNLSHCALREIPEALTELEHLEELNLDNALAGLTTVPDLSRLPRLRKLGFSGGRFLTTTPYPPHSFLDTIWNCRGLEELGIDRWGEQKDYDRRLKEQVVVRDALRELPDGFANLDRLRRLDLSFNGLQTLPDAFFRLEQLEFVDLRYNPLARPTLERIQSDLPRVKMDLRNVPTKSDVDDPHWQKVNALVQEGSGAMQCANYAEAIECFERAIEMCVPGAMYSDYVELYAHYGIVDTLGRLILRTEGERRRTLIAKLIRYARAGLELVPDPLLIWHFTDEGAFQQEVVRRVGNALAWYLYEDAESPQQLEEALAVVERAVKFVEAADHQYVLDTKVRILLAMGRDEEAYRIVERVLRHDPSFDDFQDIASSDGYRAWLQDAS